MSDLKEITIAGSTFAVLQPYAAGHTVTEAEAKALNQVRAENIRNNMASKVKAAMEGTAKEGEPTKETIAAAVTAYDEAYEFTLASVGGGKRSSDPVEVEALRIARDQFSAWATSKKTTVKAVKEKIGEEAYQAKIAELAERPENVKEAKRRVDLRNKQADNALEGLGLDDLLPADAPAEEPAH
jgi:hypothetical protein